MRKSCYSSFCVQIPLCDMFFLIELENIFIQKLFEKSDSKRVYRDKNQPFLEWQKQVVN
jgi:hypothetical protein